MRKAGVRGWGLKAAAALFGLLMLAVPAAGSPVQALALTGVGVLLVIASLVTRIGWWTSAGTLAAAISVIQCVVWPLATVGLAIEGLLVVGYLILLDGPAPTAMAVIGRWLRGQARYGIAGLVGTGAVLAALAAPSAASPWLFLAGLGAAAGVYLVALPRQPRSAGRR